jgi:hypothetical protein
MNYDHPIAAELARQVLAEYHPDLLHTTHCGDLSTSILAEAEAQAVWIVVTNHLICGRFVPMDC